MGQGLCEAPTDIQINNHFIKQLELVCSYQGSGSGISLSLNAVLHKLQMGAHEAHASTVGPSAGIAALRIIVSTGGDLLVCLIGVIHGAAISQLLMDLVDIESVNGIEETELLKDALHVATGLLLIRILPLDVLGHFFWCGMYLLRAETAITDQILMGLHNVARAMLMMMMMLMLIG